LTKDADRSSFFIALVGVDVLVGLADAVSGPYIALFLVDEARPTLVSLGETGDFVFGLKKRLPCGFKRSASPNVSPGPSQAIEIIGREILPFRVLLCFQELGPILISPLSASTLSQPASVLARGPRLQGDTGIIAGISWKGKLFLLFLIP
jgi:hypothetical protein